MRRGSTVVGVAAASGVVACAVIATRRAVHHGDPTGDLSGASVPLDRPARPALGCAADARALPPAWEPAPLAALARWEPAAPQSAVGRAAAYLWASPLSCAGLLAGCLAAVRPAIRDGILLFAPAQGAAAAILRNRRYAAAAIGHVVISRQEPSPALIAHELVHVRHAERLGIFSAVLYVVLLAVYGYARHPMERAARRAARRTAGAP